MPLLVRRRNRKRRSYGKGRTCGCAKHDSVIVALQFSESVLGLDGHKVITGIQDEVLVERSVRRQGKRFAVDDQILRVQRLA